MIVSIHAHSRTRHESEEVLTSGCKATTEDASNATVPFCGAGADSYNFVFNENAVGISPLTVKGSNGGEKGIFCWPSAMPLRSPPAYASKRAFAKVSCRLEK